MNHSKTFVESQRGRMIEIKIDKNAELISFHFPQENDREFYSILIPEFNSDREHWHRHMMDKNWFSELMYKFIIEAL